MHTCICTLSRDIYTHTLRCWQFLSYATVQSAISQTDTTCIHWERWLRHGYTADCARGSNQTWHTNGVNGRHVWNNAVNPSQEQKIFHSRTSAVEKKQKDGHQWTKYGTGGKWSGKLAAATRKISSQVIIYCNRVKICAGTHTKKSMVNNSQPSAVEKRNNLNSTPPRPPKKKFDARKTPPKLKVIHTPYLRAYIYAYVYSFVITGLE